MEKIPDIYSDEFNEVIGDLVKKKWKQPFPISLAEFLYYVNHKRHKNFTLQINDLRIDYKDYSKFDDETNEYEILIDSIKIDVGPHRDLGSWKKYVDNYLKLKKINEKYFTTDRLIKKNISESKTKQIAFIDDKYFDDKVSDFIGKNEDIDVFPLPLPEFLYWLIKYAGDIKLRIKNLYFYKEADLWDPNIIIITFNDKLKTNDIYQFEKSKESGISLEGSENEFSAIEFSKIKEYINTGKSKNLKIEIESKGNLNLKNIGEKYFIKSSETIIEGLLNKINKLINKDNIAINNKFIFSNKITQGEINVKYTEILSHEDVSDLLLNQTYYTHQFVEELKIYTLDINTHIISSSHNIISEYNIHSLSSEGTANIETKINFYFDVYPVEIYYTDNGLGYYRLKFINLCERNTYSERDLKKWYKEIYPRRSIKDKDKDKLCKDIENWINKLNANKISKMQQ